MFFIPSQVFHETQKIQVVVILLEYLLSFIAKIIKFVL